MKVEATIKQPMTLGEGEHKGKEVLSLEFAKEGNLLVVKVNGEPWMGCYDVVNLLCDLGLKLEIPPKPPAQTIYRVTQRITSVVTTRILDSEVKTGESVEQAAERMRRKMVDDAVFISGVDSGKTVLFETLEAKIEGEAKTDAKTDAKTVK